MFSRRKITIAAGHENMVKTLRVRCFYFLKSISFSVRARARHSKNQSLRMHFEIFTAEIGIDYGKLKLTKQ